jgi:hypothetical protein
MFLTFSKVYFNSGLFHFRLLTQLQGAEAHRQLFVTLNDLSLYLSWFGHVSVKMLSQTYPAFQLNRLVAI